jgi:hypothetical protein
MWAASWVCSPPTDTAENRLATLCLRRIAATRRRAIPGPTLARVVRPRDVSKPQRHRAAVVKVITRAHNPALPSTFCGELMPEIAPTRRETKWSERAGMLEVLNSRSARVLHEESWRAVGRWRRQPVAARRPVSVKISDAWIRAGYASAFERTQKQSVHQERGSGSTCITRVSLSPASPPNLL